MPLKVGDDEDYMLALKQEMRGTMRQLPHSIKPLKPKAGKRERERATAFPLTHPIMLGDCSEGEIMQHSRA